ncbi:DUF4397 domain-containing protein [Chitinophaga varians]|uniref:DUF4397 domain-containing protein n=1 Tax=Chitinophaga varians TaxID=2202339 RepID=A0A847RY11_9BACT|nr:DUF4397 domain-containing protein [Chitinophaga varians]NLR64201.1 DUF4397 domain-containing protein [Chitinophaga varians]
MKRISIIAGVLLAGTSVITSCKKDKLDHFYDNRINNDTRTNSGVRIVNLAGFNQLIANGDTLTNYVVLPVNEDKSRYPATKFFPDKGRLGGTWWVPRQFIQAGGKAHMKIEAISLNPFVATTEFDVQEDYNQPADYYVTRNNLYTTGNIPEVLRVPRSVEAPSRPDHFKIRILNLSGDIKRPESGQEKILGPLSLAFADGTLVNAKSSHVNVGEYSEYVEVPYGTYQFRVLTAAGTQVTATGGPREEFVDLVDPATSTVTKTVTSPVPRPVSVNLTYAPIRTFQPGGIYTIVVSTQELPYKLNNGSTGDESTFYQNAFQIIADIVDPTNTTYGRLQAVNALPGAGALQLKVNGIKVGDNIAYANAGEYTNVVTGTTAIEVTDATGKVLATAQKRVDPGGNYTAWVYGDAKGTPQIVIAANNLSGSIPRIEKDGQDGSLWWTQYKYPFQFRFYNFCPDFANVNFTGINGQAIGRNGVSSNLKPGIIPDDAANAVLMMAADPYEIMVFQANPGVFPGTWITRVPVIKSADLIARKELYVRGGLPDQEPGYYSIALIGKDGANTPEGSKAKMIIVKHNR